MIIKEIDQLITHDHFIWNSSKPKIKSEVASKRIHKVELNVPNI